MSCVTKVVYAANVICGQGKCDKCDVMCACYYPHAANAYGPLTINIHNTWTAVLHQYMSATASIIV
jgi:hypothetical protein